MGDTTAGSRLRGPFGELRPLAAALTLGFGLSLAPATYAATFTVSNLNDSGAGSLRDAVNQANLAIGADTINFTVTGTIPLASQIVISDSVTITGPGAASLTVSPTGTDRVFYINHEIVPNVTISGITIQRTSGSTTGKGGAIYNYGGSLTIQNCVISGNRSTASGGAIYNYGGTVSIQNSVISGNVSGDRGGAIYNHNGTVNIVNSSLTGNTAYDSGGAIYNYKSSANLNITNSTLSGNIAARGGAVYEYNGSVSIVGSTLSGNQAPGNEEFGGGSGGALYARNGSLSITNSTFSGNTAQYDGGAISTYTAVTISNSTFSGNVATNGGGGAVAFGYTTVNLVSTILANSTDSNVADSLPKSTNSGGTRDLFLFRYEAPPAAKPHGAHHHVHGIHKALTTGSHHSAKAKIAKAAQPVRTKAAHKSGIFTVNATNSLIENDGGFLNGTNTNNILGQDPVLGPLANNGGPTQTLALLAGSPAIDKGSNPNALAFDQRGSPFVRTSGAQTDIGAFEVQGGAPPPPPPVTALDIPTLSQWGTVILSGLLGIWAAVTGFGRRRKSDGN